MSSLTRLCHLQSFRKETEDALLSSHLPSNFSRSQRGFGQPRRNKDPFPSRDAASALVEREGVMLHLSKRDLCLIVYEARIGTRKGIRSDIILLHIEQSISLQRRKPSTYHWGESNIACFRNEDGADGRGQVIEA